MFRGREEIRDAYRDVTVAQTYVDRRFVQPLGAMLHARQVGIVVDAIRRTQPNRVLEIAPGPARLTRDVARATDVPGVMVDASAQMLAEATLRLDQDGRRGRWTAVQGDAFSLPIANVVDLAYTFRLIRHFDLTDRQRIYTELARVLRPGGLLIFDAVNELVSAPLRAASPAEYKHYDALLTEPQLHDELNRAGFRVESLVGVQRRFPALREIQNLVAPRSAALARGLLELVDRSGGQPLEWIVVCRRA